MGSIAVTTGAVRVRDCPEVGLILHALDELAKTMDERQVDVRNADTTEQGTNTSENVIEVIISISGWCSGSHACEIDDKVRELGLYAVEAARFVTEWECERSVFFVGEKGQVETAESANTLAQIQALAPKLRGDDITATLNTIICDTQMPAHKKKYLEESGGLCPFCKSKDITSGQIEADGPVAWAEVECEDCGASWQDVWALVDMAETRDGDGRKVVM